MKEQFKFHHNFTSFYKGINLSARCHHRGNVSPKLLLFHFYFSPFICFRYSIQIIEMSRLMLIRSCPQRDQKLREKNTSNIPGCIRMYFISVTSALFSKDRVANYSHLSITPFYANNSQFKIPSLLFVNFS